MNINLQCACHELSYGVCGQNILVGLARAGIDVAFFPLGGGVSAPPEFHPIIQKSIENAKSYDKYAPSLKLWHENSLQAHIGKGEHIGWPIFEVNKFDIVRKTCLSNQDRLVLSSHWAKQVIEDNGIKVPTIVVPLGFDPTIFYPKDNNKKFQGEPTKFIHIGKREYRKSQVEMLECFEQAFSPNDNVKLTVVWGSELLKNISPIEYEGFSLRFKRSPLSNKIKTIEWLPSQIEVAELLRLADCGLFLSKAEGFNLGLLESMAVGNFNIIFYNSGMTEFTDEFSCMLVKPTEEEIIFDNIWFRDLNGGDGTWCKFGEYQHNQTIAYMRMVHKLKQDGGNLFNKEAISRSVEYTWENSVKKLISILIGTV